MENCIEDSIDVNQQWEVISDETPFKKGYIMYTGEILQYSMRAMWGAYPITMPWELFFHWIRKGYVKKL